jgi:HD-GYP domain-containing protein (c-di-GMP phosphodiesterase class II)
VVFASGEMHTSNDYSQEESIPEDIRQRIPPGVGGVTVPIRSENDVIGVLAVNTQMPQVVEEIQVNLLKTLVEIAGSAIQRLALHEQTERQVQRLLALSKIDLAITSNIALQPTLEVILSQVIEQLHVDAAAILRHDPLTQELIPIVQSGFRSPRTRLDSVRVGEGCAGRAISERRTVRIADLSKRNNNLRLAPGLSEEGFVSYIGVPLLVKGEVQGVLEIFHRSPLERDQEWHDFLNSLAGQTAIAVDNASLFEGLRKSNLELSQAYDATIEGWSRALDLRDRETEGHTQRVTQLTMRLARRMRVPENELADMRRGALLHDIGKMGIPDSILLKPAALTDLEWEIMKQHPTYARDLLSPMENLRDALDIPYCHHEKWDGSGYPRGLKGEEIPQAARIFAVADVYDALTSDRPYRKGWSKTKAIKYIKEQSGQHFDPDVIKVFLETVLPTKAL